MNLLFPMVMRKIFPGTGKRLVYSAVALMLVTAAVVATGCISPGLNNQTRSLPEGKFVFLQHRINVTAGTLAGYCHLSNPSGPGIRTPSIFEEKTGVLTVSGNPDRDEPINDSLVLFYGREYSSNWYSCENGYSGLFVYSLPHKSDSISIESVKSDGIVEMRSGNTPIVLRPGERWEHSARRIQSMGPVLTEITPPEIEIGRTFFIGEAPMNCTQEIVTTQSIYHAGVFDDTVIIVQNRAGNYG